jgi:hypothetical protein
MQIIPNRRKDRILVQIQHMDGYKRVVALRDEMNANYCNQSPECLGSDGFLMSVPVTTKTKSEMARKLRSKFKGLTGTIKWERGMTS